MRRFKTKRLLWILSLAPIALVANLLLTIIFVYFVLVFDIYLNTEKLSKIDNSMNAFCQNVAHNSIFTKGQVVFRVDRGTLLYRLHPYISGGGDPYGYAPFFIFPHHRTIILAEEVLKTNNLALKSIVAHEMGHIQGGLKHFGPTSEMEQYANGFAEKITKPQP